MQGGTFRRRWWKIGRSRNGESENPKRSVREKERKRENESEASSSRH